LTEQAVIEIMNLDINNLWQLFATMLVLSMQVGFLLLEAGRVRTKNSINVAQKNVSDLIVSWTAFFLFGHFLMTGNPLPLYSGPGVVDTATGQQVLEFMYLLGFCAAAASIVSGGVAERMTFRSYLLMAFVTGGILFPIVGRAVWSQTETAWLASMGFVDFAGSTVVHGTGAWVALAAILLLGPRIGRYDKKGKVLPIAGHNSVISLVGALILLIGWFGFNTGTVSVGSPMFVHVLLNTATAATFGAAAGMLAGAYLDKGKFNPPRVINGMLGGLVAITACADQAYTVEAAILGSLAGAFTVFCAEWMMVRLRIDDPVDVVAVHGCAGVLGTLAVAFVGPASVLPAGGRLAQLMIQLLGVIVVFAFVFGFAWVTLKIYMKWSATRVTAEEERLGLNYTEHGESVGTDRLKQALEEKSKMKGGLDQRLMVEDGDEASDLAFSMNQLLDKHDEARKEIRESQIRFADFALTASDWLWETNTRLTVKFLSMGGKEQDVRTLAGSKPAKLFKLARISTEEIVVVRDAIRSKKPFGPVDALLNVPGHGDRLVSIRGRARINASGEFVGYRGTFNDVTERRSAEKRANFLSRHDELTGLANRRALTDDITNIQKTLPSDSGMVVAALDLDGFKKINDAYGHSIGDDLLKAVAARMRESMRGSDQLYRTGGDEFVMLLPMFSLSTIRQEIANWCDKLIDAIAAPYTSNGQTLNVGVSIGVALFPEHGKDSDRLAHLADLALYAAKAAGKGCMVIFEPAMDIDARYQLQFETELRNAVRKNQFTLEYQPQQDGKTGKLVGFEALLRWDHPVRGKVSSSEFIPAAERLQLMGDLGSLALYKACEFASQWPPGEDGELLTISVNVSPSQFQNDRIVIDVEEALENSGLAASQLELEVTEELLIGDFDMARDTLVRLSEIGVSIAIDDFGSGQTSLRYLNNFPISKLKIDQTFVRKINADSRAKEITHSIVMLGHKLGCVVAAEGVEEETQQELLRQWDCDQIQGHVFSKPMPADDAMKMLNGSSPAVEPTTAAT
jgi:Amt family ammonium transporter